MAEELPGGLLPDWNVRFDASNIALEVNGVDENPVAAQTESGMNETARWPFLRCREFFRIGRDGVDFADDGDLLHSPEVADHLHSVFRKKRQKAQDRIIPFHLLEADDVSIRASEFGRHSREMETLRLGIR